MWFFLADVNKNLLITDRVLAIDQENDIIKASFVEPVSLSELFTRVCKEATLRECMWQKAAAWLKNQTNVLNKKKPQTFFSSLNSTFKKPLGRAVWWNSTLDKALSPISGVLFHFPLLNRVQFSLFVLVRVILFLLGMRQWTQVGSHRPGMAWVNVFHHLSQKRSAS